MEFSLQALVRDAALVSAERIDLIGDGTVPTAAALLRADPARRVRLLVPAAEAAEVDARRAALPVPLRERLDLVPAARPVDALADDPSEVLLVQLALDGASDEEVRGLAAAAPDTLLLLTDLADHAAQDDHRAADALTALATTGVPLRRSDRWAELLGRSGFGEVRPSPLGWGFGPSLITARR